MRTNERLLKMLKLRVKVFVGPGSGGGRGRAEGLNQIIGKYLDKIISLHSARSAFIFRDVPPRTQTYDGVRSQTRRARRRT
ncbi:hypothetical protein EVAR_78411_1 [Eumeta japonica]|uniref:Uncharacterized protein n=1 Tax=Eumeta variegata TaxID=151549 RepID=A0A4C1T4Q3_EUMVA|nr:hypothetical protein EVAR_78411_1 [Eumeta japonica]